MIDSVTLIGSPASDQSVGLRTYEDSLSLALQQKGVVVRNHSYWKRDFWLFGRNFGAVATPLISRLRLPAASDVTHALFSNFTSGSCSVVTVLDLVWRFGGYPEAKILNSLYRRKIKKSVVVCPTDVVSVQVSQWLNLDDSRIFTTHLAPDKSFAVTKTEKFSTPTVLLVGDANERKRTLESVKALEGLNVRVLHAGRFWNDSVYGQACSAEAHRLGLDFSEVGPVPRQDLVKLYNQSHVLLYPSSNEGFGLPPLEAAACGLQAVVGKHPVFGEVMGETCHPCDGRKPESIRRAVEQAFASPIRKVDLVSLASKFSWERCADETLEAYEASL